MKNDPITLSGRVFLAGTFENYDEERTIPDRVHSGDIKIWCRLDAEGRCAAEGRHANYGYSGYFKASVCDGRKWRNFKIWNFVGEIIRRYATQKEKHWKLDLVIEELEQRKGAVATWGDRTYELTGDFSEAIKDQGTKVFNRKRAAQEEQRLAEQAREREARQRARQFSYANELLKSGQVVEGRVVWLSTRNSAPCFELELNEGLSGTLSATFIKCHSEQERLRRCQSLQKGDRLRVQVVRVHNRFANTRVDLVEEGADLSREIHNAYERAGAKFDARVIGEAINSNGCYGLFVRIMDLFGALLHVSNADGRTRAEQLKHLQDLRARGSLSVQLLSIAVANDKLRIDVRELAQPLRS